MWWREGGEVLGFGLFHCPAAGLANFSNLQTVWAQAQGSEAKDSALQDSRLADSSHSWTHISSGTSDNFQGGKPLVQAGQKGTGPLRRERGREGDEGTRRAKKDKWGKDLRSAVWDREHQTK